MNKTVKQSMLPLLVDSVSGRKKEGNYKAARSKSLLLR